MTSSIVLVCENSEAGRAIETHLRTAGLHIRSFQTAFDAVSFFSTRKPDIACLITDTRSFGISGWDLARIARQSNRHVGVIYLGSGDVEDWLVQGVPRSTIFEPGWDAARFADFVVEAIDLVGGIPADR